jgi:transcriptional regulator with XRE-family HTH domain
MKKLDRGQHYIAEWRKYRNLSLRKLADRLAVSAGGDLLLSHTSLSRIEKGEQPFTEESLNAIAVALNVDRVQLLSTDPYKDGEIIDILRKLDGRDRARIIDMMRLMAKTA